MLRDHQVRCVVHHGFLRPIWRIFPPDTLRPLPLRGTINFQQPNSCPNIQALFIGLIQQSPGVEVSYSGGRCCNTLTQAPCSSRSLTHSTRSAAQPSRCTACSAVGRRVVLLYWMRSAHCSWKKYGSFCPGHAPNQAIFTAEISVDRVKLSSIFVRD